MAVSTPAPDLGKPLPSFRLPGVDGAEHAVSEYGAKALLVVFTCNHCPYAQAVEQRILDLAKAYDKAQLQVVAICSNDAAAYPEDGFDALKARWQQWQAKGYNVPYLHDEAQQVAKLFGAVCTPDYFLYDASRKLAYRGRLDDNWKDASKVTRQEMKEAIDALLAGKPAPTDQKPSMGCSIKWQS
jgi:peroxiredoxin